MAKNNNSYKESISELQGNLVVSFDEGERLGSLGEVYLDKRSCGIKGISLSSKLLEPEERNFIGFKDILKLGTDVVIISKKSVLRAMPEGLESSCLRILNNIRVVTQDGEKLGEMVDFSIIAESGIIHEITLLGDRKMRINVEEDKIQIGPDMIVVPAAYKANISSSSKQSEDTFNSVVKNAERITRRFADSITGTINEAVQKVVAASRADSGRDDAKQDDRSKAKPGKTKNEAGDSKGEAPKVSPRKKVAKKTTAKKTSAKKAVTKKAATKKATTKKAATKKTPAKKAPAGKATGTKKP